MDDPERLRDDVAREVMCWTAGRIRWAYEGSAEMWHTSERVPVVPRSAWRPDESDTQCMQVVDRMARRGFDYTLGAAGGSAFAAFARGRHRPARTEHPERRIAVLRAALAALRRPGTDPL